MNSINNAAHKYQLSDPDEYFVHHMSDFEHSRHKAYGMSDAEQMAALLAVSAFDGECKNAVASKNKNYIVIMPFFGGVANSLVSICTRCFRFVFC